MRRLIVALVVAVLGLTLINLGQGIGNRHTIEDDLTGRSERALAAAGVRADVTFRGRDGTVTVATAADRDRARQIVRDLTGVRVVSVAAPDAAAPGDPAAPSAPASDPAAPSAPPAPSDPGMASASPPPPAPSGSAALPAPSGSPALPAPSDPAAEPSTPSDPAPPAQPKPAEIQARLSELPRVTFANNSATLTASGRRVVADVAKILNANPAVRVTIQGHTDSRGSAAANRTLSAARARAVRDSLVAAGITAGRLTATGLGESRPKVTNTTEAGRNTNRRVEFIVR